MIAWGISWPIGKLTTQGTQPEIIVFWRNGATTLSLLPLVYIYRNHLKISKLALRKVLLGALLMSSYNYLFFMGLSTGMAGLGGVIVTTTNPLINYFLLIGFGLHKVSKYEISGLILGGIGGILLLRVWEIQTDEFFKGGNLLFLIASFLWAVLTIISSRSKNHLHPFIFSFYVYIFSTIFTFPLAYIGDFFSVLHLGTNFWLGIFYLSAVSTGFGTTIYFIASSKLGSGKASSFILLVPGTAILSSWLMINEVPNFTTLMGGLLAIIAVKIIQSSPDEKVVVGVNSKN